LAIFYRDDKTHVESVIEAHIEFGSVVTPFAKYRADGKLRASVYRYPDAQLAHEAAKYMYQKVKDAADRGDNIKYDFGLDMQTDERLFCSELVYWAYRHASNDQLKLPLNLSVLDPRVSKFHQSIGIFVNQAFLPADMEIETRFQWVAEWRDYSQIRSTHIKDASLNSMYNWMAEKNYVLHPTAKSFWLSWTAFPARQIPWLGTWLLGDKFPPYMQRSVFKTIVTLDGVHGLLIGNLEKANAAAQKSRGIGLSVPEMMDYMEALRVEDSKLQASGDENLFHEWLYPDN
jgi:hypothetical protein